MALPKDVMDHRKLPDDSTPTASTASESSCLMPIARAPIFVTPGVTKVTPGHQHVSSVVPSARADGRLLPEDVAHGLLL
jgi:hypothetical protein